jgi:hypothetical protein
MRQLHTSPPARNGHSEADLRALVERCGVPSEQADTFTAFAREFLRTLRRRPVSDFSRATKRVVQKWFERGLAGHLLASVGFEVLRRRYPRTEV